MSTSLITNPQIDYGQQQHWGLRIAAAWQRQVSAIIETGRLLIEAKDDLPHGDWLRMVKNHLPFSQSTANKLMAIASCEHLSNSEYLPNLPAKWSLLHELTQLEPQGFKDACAEGKITPKLTTKAVKALRHTDSDDEPELEEPKPSPMAILKRQLEESHRENAHLQELVNAADAGSLFDLKEDTPSTIAAVVTRTISKRRWKDIRKAIDDAYADDEPRSFTTKPSTLATQRP